MQVHDIQKADKKRLSGGITLTCRLAALFATAASTHPALAQRTAFTPRPTGGDRQIDVRATAAIGYNDNVVAGDPRISGGGSSGDVLVEPSLNANIVLPRASGSTYLAGSLGYRFYDKFTRLNRENISLTGGADQRLGSCLVHGEVGYQRRVSDLAAFSTLDPVGGTSNTEEARNYTADIGCSTPIGLRPAVSYSRTEVRNNRVQRQFADVNTDAVTGQIGFQASMLGTISVFGRYGTSTYINRPSLLGGTGRDGIKSYAAGVQLERYISPRLNLRGSVNYTKVNPRLPGTPGFSGIGFNLGATYDANLFTVQLSGSRAAQPSVVYFVSYEILTALSASVSHELGTRSQITLSASKSWRDYSSSSLSPGAPISGNDNTLSLGANASYNATRRLRFVLSAGYDERSTNTLLYKYNAKRVTFTTSLAL